MFGGVLCAAGTIVADPVTTTVHCGPTTLTGQDSIVCTNASGSAAVVVSPLGLYLTADTTLDTIGIVSATAELLGLLELTVDPGPAKFVLPCFVGQSMFGNVTAQAGTEDGFAVGPAGSLDTCTAPSGNPPLPLPADGVLTLPFTATGFTWAMSPLGSHQGLAWIRTDFRFFDQNGALIAAEIAYTDRLLPIPEPLLLPLTGLLLVALHRTRDRLQPDRRESSDHSGREGALR